MNRSRPTRLYVTAYFLLLLALAWQAGRWSHDRMLVQLNAQGADRLLNSISHMRRALGQFNYLPFLVSQNLQVRDFLRRPDEERRTLVNRVLEQLNLLAGSTALFVLDPEGTPLAFSNWRDAASVRLASQRERDYFRQALAGEQGQELIWPGDGQGAAIMMSAPIYDGRLAGVAAMRVDLARLREQLDSDYPLVVMAPSGQPVFRIGTDWPLPVLAEKQLDNGTRQVLVQGEVRPLIRQQVVLDDLGWTVLVLTDTLPARQRELLVFFSVLGGGTALGLLLLYLRESRQKRRIQRERMLERERSEQRQRDIINTAQVGLIQVDRRGFIELMNPMALQLFGVSAELIRHRPVRGLLGAGFSTGPIEQVLAALGSDRFRPLTGQEAVGVRADGSEFPMLMSIRQMRHHPELGYLVTVIDISRRKRLEQALREANESLEQKVEARTRALEEAQAELVQAGKLAALGRMSASVVHELNQPMTAMRTYLAIARKQLDNPEALSRNFGLLHQLLDRMALITGQLKTFAYRKPERIEPVALQQVLNQVLQLFRGRIDELQIELQLQMPTAALLIAGDAARYEQVLINLIKNACDALAEQAPPRRLWIELVARQSDRVELDVRDNGPGIAAEHRAQIFEPFFTTKEVGQGLGLGLAIVHSILRDLGGSIRILARDDGACFRLELPLYAKENGQ